MAEAQYSPLRFGMATAYGGHQPMDQPQPNAEPLLKTAKVVTVPRGWPTSPQPVHNPVWIVISNFIFDIFLLLGALAFLTFALTVNRYDQASTIENPRATQRLQSATKYGPTVFPILFASIIGRAAHAILLWRLEKGERVGILDILATSTSLTSTVTCQFQLRIVSVLGLVLVAIWALSPVGGQASIRQMTIGMKNQSHPASFGYMVHNGDLSAFQYSDRASPLEIASTLFLGALIGSVGTKRGPRDNWGNVKIPKIEHYEQKSTADADGWFDTKEGDISSWSSLIGIPVDGINQTNFIDYEMNMQTPYLNLDCLFPQLVGDKDASNYTEYIYANAGEGAQSANGTGGFIWYPNVRSSPGRWLQDPASLTPLYFTWWPIHSGGNITRCSITSSYVETQVSCSITSNCTVSRIRRSRLDHLPPAWTFLDIHWQYLGTFLNAFMGSAKGKPANPSLLDRYISDPLLVVTFNNTFSVAPAGESDTSIRLGQLINTYFTALGGIYAISGGITNESAYYDQNQSFIAPPLPLTDGLNDSSPRQYYNWTGQNRKARMWSTQGTKLSSSEIIVAHKRWVATLSIASALLIVSSLVSPCVRFFLINGPEVMMNISSLATRNNPYVPLPGNGTYLDASDRARLLKRLRVRFGDVQSGGDPSGNDVGHLAIGSFEKVDSDSIARIHKRRWYE